MQLLLIEDDRDLAANIIDFLELKGHEVDYAQTLRAATALLADNQPDALIVDRMLPDGDALQLVLELRSGNSALKAQRLQLEQLPVLFLTARDSEADKLAGFAAGADDYLVKPFSLAELAARIEAIGRRLGASFHQGDCKVGPLVLLLSQSRVLHQQQPLSLPPLQNHMLIALMQSHPESLTREELSLAVWRDLDVSENKFKVQLHGLRQRLKAVAGVSVITERGVGVRLVVQ